MGLSIVIPAYNEENRIEETIKKIQSSIKGDFEIIVIDDFSSDRTYDIAYDMGTKVYRNNKNMGKGFSVKKGVLNAKHEFVLFTDADLATPLEELKKMMTFIKDFDIVIASRNMPDSNVEIHQPFYRKFLGKMFPLLVNLFVIKGIKDTQCGFKLFKTEVAKEICRKQKIDGFAFDVEILYLAKIKNYSIKEVGVKWVDKAGSTVNPLRDSFKMLRDILKIRFINKYV